MAYLGNPSNTMSVLQKYNLTAQKRYGQNFLVDSNVLNKIVESAGITKEDTVLEIGPGIGSLTQYLCESAKNVICVEIDTKMIPVLEDTLSEYENVRVINEDILKVDIDALRVEFYSGQDINADVEQLQCVGGYDHNFCVDGEEGVLRQAAFAKSPKSGITLKCLTTLPGIQLYVGNFLKSKVGKENTEYKPRDGFCLETQFYPNSVNQKGFPDPIFGPDREYDCVTVYQFN